MNLAKIEKMLNRPHATLSPFELVPAIGWLLDQLAEMEKSRDSWRAESKRVHAELSDLLARKGQ